LSEDWSRAEVDLAVADYLNMLASELREESYTKADHWRALQPQLRDRTKGSIEFKYGNVSAALRDLGYPFVDGYKPYANYQALVIEVVQAQVQARSDIIELIKRDVTRPVTFLAFDDILSALVDRPEPSTRQGQKPAKPDAWFEKPRVLGAVNYLEIEAANRTLGEAGEEFAERFEIARLCAADRESLAAKVERVSHTRGDGAGFDILSFETDGRERLVEVKTTRYGRYTPFFLSRNEVRTSDAYSKQYALYRLFQFRKQPKLFVLPGAVRSSCRLDPSVFEAILA
jgi:hypothetical protein